MILAGGGVRDPICPIPYPFSQMTACWFRIPAGGHSLFFPGYSFAFS